MNESVISPPGLLATYSGLILLASLAGGWIPLVVRLTHTRLQLAISFVSGLMLGVGLLHLLPHAWQELKSIDRTAAWLLGGFLAMFLIQRFLHFHHHDVPEELGAGVGDPPKPAACGHNHDAEAESSSLAAQSARRLSWTGAVLGLMLHTVLGGMALGASVEAEANAHGPGWFLGVGTFLVIFLHKPFDALAIGTLMARSGRSKSLRHWVNGFFALGIPLGVLLFHAGASRFSGSMEHFVGMALAFSAGTFLCIAASDLLPELQFHEHDRLKLSLALMLGLAFSLAIGHFETAGHEHHDPTPLPSLLDTLPTNHPR